jgi:hypothetical protein
VQPPCAVFPRAVFCAGALAALLSLPALGIGFFGDELLQLLALEGRRAPASLSRLNLWRFASGRPDDILQSVRDGFLMWNTDPHYKAAFLRPLSSLLFTAEHAVFGRSPAGYHVLSLLLSLLVIGAVGLVYRRALEDRLAALALVLFAVQGAHWETTGYLCASHFLVATAPSMAGLAAHVRHREEGWKPGRWLSLLGFAIGLAGAESALQTMAYLLAYEIAGARDRWRDRLRAVAPFGGLAVAYVAAYKLRGYGTYGEGYADPFAEPGRYLGHVFGVARIVLSLLDGYPGVAGDTYEIRLLHGSSLYAWRWPMLAAAALGLAALFALARRCPPEVAGERDRRAVTWLLAGTVLSLAPIVGGVPGPRLLLVPGAGVAAGVALVLRWAWAALRGGTASGPWARAGVAGLGAALAVAHGVASPAALALNLIRARDKIERHTSKLEAIVRDSGADPSGQQDVVVLSSALLPKAIAVMVDRVFPEAQPWVVLSFSQGEEDVIRTGPATLELRAHDAPDTPDAKVVRRLRLRRGLDLAALEAAPGAPHVALRTDRALDDPSLCFLTWQDGGLRRVEMPPVGGRLTLPASRAVR